MKKLILLALALVVVGVVLMIRFLPWWASVAVFVAGAVALRFCIPALLTRLLTIPFKAKGAVLRGAAVEVHSVQPAAAPNPENASAEEESDEPEAQPKAARCYYQLEVTINPAATDGPFQMWEPGELRLVGLEAKASYESDDRAENVCSVEQVEVHQDGGFQQDEGFKFSGPQRLRLLLAADEGVKAVQFRYYFELFGRVELPVEGRRELAA